MRLARHAVCAYLCAVIGAIGLEPRIVRATEDTGEASDVVVSAISGQASAPDAKSGILRQTMVKSLEQPRAVQMQAVLGPRKGCNRCAEDPDCPCRYWDFRLDLNAATGRSSFGGDNEWQFYRFSQTLHTPRGNEFEFWQEWENDHSFITGREWGLGAEQRIPDFWNDGSLRAVQEYRDYRDLNQNNQRRKQFDLRLRLDPRWEAERVRARFDYRLRTVDYPLLPSDSYVLHDARLDVEHEVNSELRASSGLHSKNYNYGPGSNRSNNLLRSEARLDWKFDDSASAYLQGSREDKNYNSRPDRNYDLNSSGFGLRWDPDSVSTVSADVERSYYDRPFAPDRSYDEWQAQGRYRRQLSCQLDLDLRYLYRDKRYAIDPLSDSTQRQGSALLNYMPDEHWNYQAGWQRSDYAFANPLRANLSDVYTLGAGYRLDESYVGFNWRRNESDFTGAPQFSNTRDDYDFEFQQQGCDWRWRSYLGFGRLAQQLPGNLNNFREQRLGMEWGYDFDCRTTLNLRYDYFERRYALQNAFEDSRIEAGLTYKF